MSSFGPLWQVAKELPLKTVEKDRLQKKVAIRSHGEILQFVLHMQYSIIAPFQSLLQLGVSRILHLQINLCKARISHNSPKMYFQNVTPHPCTLYCRYSFQKYREICTLYRESSHIMVSHRILIHPFVHCARTFCILKKLLLDILSKYI